LRQWVEREAAAPRPASAVSPPWLDEFRRLTAPVAPDSLDRLLELVRGNVATLADLPRELSVLLDDAAGAEPEALRQLEGEAARALCGTLADALDALAQWSSEAFKSALLESGARLGKKGKDLFQPVRAALTGRTHGPELPLLAELLGRERAVARLRAAAAAPIGQQGDPGA
jgi:nondiscriminating glutamyl-tRNA synthetase